MLIKHSDLKKKALLIDKRIYPSQFNKPYKLYHFKWEPTDEEGIKNKQQTLL